MRLIKLIVAGFMTAACGLSFNPDLPSANLSSLDGELDTDDEGSGSSTEGSDGALIDEGQGGSANCDATLLGGAGGNEGSLADSSCGVSTVK